MKELSRDYLVRMFGCCFEDLDNRLITEYCSRGSLQDVLENDELQLDDMFKHSLLHDIVKVQNFLNIILLKFTNVKSLLIDYLVVVVILGLFPAKCWPTTVCAP